MTRNILKPALGLAGFLALSACIIPVPLVVPGSSRGPSAPASQVSAPAGQGGDVLRLINAEREREGLHPLSWSDRLAASAADHASWIASTGTFSHTGQGGSSAPIGSTGPTDNTPPAEPLHGAHDTYEKGEIGSIVREPISGDGVQIHQPARRGDQHVDAFVQ